MALPDVDATPGGSNKARTKRATKNGCEQRIHNGVTKRSAPSGDADFCNRLKRGEDVYEEGQGFFAKVGRMFTSLTGQPTFDDIKIVDKHICELSDLAELNANAITVMGDRLSSFSANMDGRLNALESGLCDINMRVDETQEILRNITGQIYVGMDRLRVELIRSQRATDAMIRMQKYLYNVSAAIRGIGQEVENFGLGINTLLTGHLPPTLVGIGDVKRVIDVVAQETAASTVLALVETNPAFYYMTENIIYSYSPNRKRLYVTMTIPLYSQGGLMASYRVDRTFIGMQEGNVSSTRIDNLPDYFLVTADQDYYSEMSVTEMTGCRGKNVKICDLGRSLQAISRLSCVAALYTDSHDVIIELCDIRLEHGPIESGAVKLDNNTYLMHSKTPKNSQWTLSCPVRASVATQNMASCTACLVQVPCGCQFHAPGEFTIGLQLQGCNDLTSSSELTPAYPINLALLHLTGQFKYGIKANSLSNTEWSINIPPLRPIGQEWQDAVERSHRYSADLKLLAKRVKRITPCIEPKRTHC
jgi:hypothetical protein